jgi:hypothetical protein
VPKKKEKMIQLPMSRAHKKCPEPVPESQLLKLEIKSRKMTAAYSARLLKREQERWKADSAQRRKALRKPAPASNLIQVVYTTVPKPAPKPIKFRYEVVQQPPPKPINFKFKVTKHPPKEKTQ